MKNLLSIDSVSKKFGSHTALNNISLNIPEGCIYGLLGPNGAGKTTLIRIINQISLPDSGKVFFNNQELNASHIKQIGYLPEERGLYPKMKIGEQAIYLAQLKGMDRKMARLELKKWFEKFEISNWWNKKVTELSKGMAQKVQFIVTVLHKPKLLIFDEPFSGFDPINANLIKDEILELNKDDEKINKFANTLQIIKTDQIQINEAKPISNWIFKKRMNQSLDQIPGQFTASQNDNFYIFSNTLNDDYYYLIPKKRVETKINVTIIVIT